MATTFQVTHEIELSNGSVVPVRLVDGAAYTRAEWNSETAADYERQDDGTWTFQGRPFNGTVRSAEVR